MGLRFSIAHCIALCTILLLSACSTGPFSGAAAMRIEVEVYKGPLSLDPEIQLGELRGYLLEAYSSLINTYKFTLAAARTKNFPRLGSNAAQDKEFPPAEEWCLDVPAVGYLLNQADHFDCALLQSIGVDTLNLLRNLTRALDTYLYGREGEGTARAGVPGQETLTTFQTQLKDYIEKTHNFTKYLPSNALSSDEIPGEYLNIKDTLRLANDAAAAMQSAAFRYATALTAGQSINFKVRIASVNFIVSASEYSNQIGSRADALMKQFGSMDGRDRRELPLSVHLREAEPTDFVHLYKWMDATSPALVNYFIIGSGTVDDRIKIIDRLYADHYWSKINTVHASGRGKTQMAFIKDETGNWNLKSFDNDPSELLEGYAKVAKTALDGVVKIAARAAKAGASGGGAEVAQQLLALADQTALAKTAQPAQSKGMLSLDHLRARIASQLDSAHVQGDITKDNDLLGKVTSAKTALEAATKVGETPEADRARSDLEKVTADLQRHRKETITRWTALVEDHSNLVDMLGSTIRKK